MRGLSGVGLCMTPSFVGYPEVGECSGDNWGSRGPGVHGSRGVQAWSGVGQTGQRREQRRPALKTEAAGAQNKGACPGALRGIYDPGAEVWGRFQTERLKPGVLGQRGTERDREGQGGIETGGRERQDWGWWVDEQPYAGAEWGLPSSIRECFR